VLAAVGAPVIAWWRARRAERSEGNDRVAAEPDRLIGRRAADAA